MEALRRRNAARAIALMREHFASGREGSVLSRKADNLNLLRSLYHSAK